MHELDGKVAFITGAGRGIGRAIALAMADAGAAVALAGRNMAALEQAGAEITGRGGRALPLVCDVASHAAVADAVGAAGAALGPIDILVNNAGVIVSAKVTDTSPESWDQVIQTNLSGAFYCCRAVIPAMIARRWGRIINIASIAATVGMPYAPAYSAAKHGMLGLTRSLAPELARYGITVNAICPAWVETEMMQQAVANLSVKTGRAPSDAQAELLRQAGQQRAVTPAEVAAAALRLASPASSETTGAALMLP